MFSMFAFLISLFLFPILSLGRLSSFLFGWFDFWLAGWCVYIEWYYTMPTHTKHQHTKFDQMKQKKTLEITHTHTDNTQIPKTKPNIRLSTIWCWCFSFWLLLSGWFEFSFFVWVNVTANAIHPLIFLVRFFMFFGFVTFFPEFSYGEFNFIEKFLSSFWLFFLNLKIWYVFETGTRNKQNENETGKTPVSRFGNLRIFFKLFSAGSNDQMKMFLAKNLVMIITHSRMTLAC